MDAQYQNAIGSVESDNNYNALGPETDSGDRAYGRYQVMGNNIPDWTQKHLGKSMTPQEFLADPDAQDKVFDGETSASMKKYGNLDDVTSTWFSGRPMKQAGNASDGYNTTPQYISKVNAAYNSPDGPTAIDTAMGRRSTGSKAMAFAPTDDDNAPGALNPAQPTGALTAGGSPVAAQPSWLDTLGQTLMNMAPGISQDPAHAQALAAVAAAQQKATTQGSWSTSFDPKTGKATQTNSATGNTRQFQYAAPTKDDKVWKSDGGGRDAYGKPIPGYAPTQEEWEATQTPEAKAQAADAAAATKAQASVTGQPFMDALTKKDAGYAGRVQGIVDGREALPTGRAAMEDTPGGQLVKDVMQADPTYEQGNALARVKLRQAYETATAPNSPSVLIKNGNTTLEHGGTLSDAIEKFKSFSDHKDSSIPYASYYENAFHNSQLPGNSTPEAQAYASAVDAREHYGDEISKYYGGGPAGEHAKQRALANIDFAKSLPELRSVMATDGEMVSGKSNSLQEAWRNGMRGSSQVADFPIFSKTAQASADRIKGRYEQSKGGDAPASDDTGPSSKPAAQGTYKSPQGTSIPWSLN